MKIKSYWLPLHTLRDGAGYGLHTKHEPDHKGIRNLALQQGRCYVHFLASFSYLKKKDN